MSARLGFEMAVENAYELLRSVTCTGEVYSEGFGLNLRMRTDGPGEETYTLDSSSAKSRGITTVFYCEDGKWLETHTTPDWETVPDRLDQLDSDCNVLVRTLNSPIHFRRGGDGGEGHHAVLDLLASLSMPLVAKCDLTTLINALATGHPLLVPSAPGDSIPYPAISDEDFSIVADPEGKMVILRMAEGTWIKRLDQAGIGWILEKLAVS